MQKSQNFWRWVGKFALCSPLIFLPIFIFFHLFLKVPSAALVSPSLAFCGLVILQAPLLYWAREYSNSHRKDKRAFVCVVTENSIALTLIGVHYAVAFKTVDSHVGAVLSWTVSAFYLLVGCLIFTRSGK
jgi:hypothetical protein